MNRSQVIKVALFLIFMGISSSIGCKNPSTESLNKIIFERDKTIGLDKALKNEKRPITHERFNEIVKTLSFHSQIVIMDDNGKNQRIIIEKLGKEIRLSHPFWLDDKKILFVLDNKQKGSIWMIEKEGTNQVKLTNENFNVFSPIISPDGKEIAFSSNRTGRGEIYIINTNDTNVRNWKKVTDTPPIDKQPVDYSSDGKRIIFLAGELQEPNPNEYYKKYKDFDIYSIDTNGEGIKKLNQILTIFPQLSLSPDGEKIVYNDFCNDNYEIFVMDKDGNNKKRLTYNSVGDFAPTWSPDGKKIAFVSDGMLYLMAPDGKNQVKLTDKSQCYVSYGVWSPDSKKIAFVAEGDIWTIDIEGKNLKNLTNTPDWNESCPSWRPIVK